AGREFTPHDTETTEKVFIVNEVAAHRIWPNEEAVGQIARINGVDRTVAGVVGNVRHGGLDEEPGSEMYLPMAQCFDNGAVELVVRTRLPLESLIPSVRTALREIDPTLPVTDYKSLEQL